MVIFILIGSTCFSIVFQGVDGGRWLEHLLTSLPGGAWGFLIFVNMFVFFIAFFLDFFEIVVHHRAAAGADREDAADADRRRGRGADLVRRACCA